MYIITHSPVANSSKCILRSVLPYCTLWRTKAYIFFLGRTFFLVYAVYALYALYAKIVRFLIFRTKLDEKQRFCVYMQRIFDFQQLYINHLNENYPLFYKTLKFAIY